jgi:tetratricopeptide (TPR) repeat protein
VQKKWEEAILEIERALRPQPQNCGLLFELAGFLENIQAVDGAIVALEEVVEVDKGNVESYRKLGHLWQQKGDTKKAIEAWEKLRMYKPEDKEASKAIRDLSAATLVRTIEEKKTATGDESFRAMLKSEDEAADLEKKAKAIRTDEDRIEAIRLKKEDLKKDPTNSRLWRELGALYQDLRKWDHARAAFKKALEVNPHDLFAVDKLGTLEEVIFVQRVDDARKALETANRNGAAEPQVAELRGKVEELEKALLDYRIREYDRKVKAHPTDYELKCRYGDFLMQGERFDEAIEQFQKAVKDPKFKVSAQNNMGKCFQRKRVYAVAVAQYQEALKGIMDPDSDLAKDIRYNLATACEEKGDDQGALEHYQQIMATDIGFRDVSARVDRLMQRMHSSK